MIYLSVEEDRLTYQRRRKLHRAVLWPPSSSRLRPRTTGTPNQGKAPAVYRIRMGGLSANLSQVDVVDNPTIIAGLHISPEGGRHHPEEDKISPSHNNLQRSPGHQSGEIEGGLRSPLIVSSSTRPLSTLVLYGTRGIILGLQLTETGRKAILPNTVKSNALVACDSFKNTI